MIQFDAPHRYLCFISNIQKPAGFEALPCYSIIQAMKNKSLAQSNPYLKDSARSRKMRVRSIASNTAIETGESISSIEAKLNRKDAARYRVTLA